MGVVEEDAVLTPILATVRELNPGTAQGVERVRDLDRYGCSGVITTSRC